VVCQPVSMAKLRILDFTDPGCAFAWSAEPGRRRISWLYGDQLEWELRKLAGEHVGANGLWHLNGALR
jgi:hypothetical protein